MLVTLVTVWLPSDMILCSAVMQSHRSHLGRQGWKLPRLLGAPALLLLLRVIF